jgi:hypothetical protein
VRSQFVALAVATYVGAAVLEAQTPLYNVQDMTPFAFAVVDTFHFGDADAVIVRRVNALPHDVILVRHSRLDKKWLSEALHVLAEVRAHGGDQPTQDAVFRVTEPGPKRAREDEANDWARRLRDDRPNELDGFGIVHNLVVYLPNQRK